MRQNPCYHQTTLSDKTYLLPSGQALSDHKRAILLNETGTCIWELLKHETTPKDILSAVTEHFGVPADQQDILKKDITDFLNTLAMNGAILSDLECPDSAKGFCARLSIAGLTLNLYGPRESFAPSLFDFAVSYDLDGANEKAADQTVVILYGNPAFRENGRLLVRNRELTVMDTTEKYILLFHTDSCVRELHLKKDAAAAYFYCIPNSSSLQENIFHAMRFAFLYLAQQRGILAIHSASIRYQDKAWLFSASAGTGKSTHARLWQDLTGAAPINGDLNLICMENGRPVVHGLPWCGTSDQYDSASYELGGIIFLKQAGSDFIEDLSDEDRILTLKNRLISPNWDAAMSEQQLEIAKQIAGEVFLCRLHCTKKPSAQKRLQEAIDHYLSDQD